MRRNERGIALGIVILTSVVFAVAAFAVLTMALSRMQVSRATGASRLRSTYAAEAGLVWAMQQLWADSTWGSGAGSIDHTVPYDMNGDGTIAAGEGIGVDVIIASCGAPPCPDRVLQTKVTY